MSKTKKAHRRKINARNQRILAAERKEEARKIRLPINSHNHIGAVADVPSIMKTINGGFTTDIIRKIKSMETRKKDEAKQVNMSGKATPAVVAGPEPVYKFTPEAYTAIDRFLKMRPLIEAKPLHVAFFRHGQNDPFYKQDAVFKLIDYIQQCPMEQSEPLMEMLEKGGLQQYMPVPDEKKEGEGGEKKEEQVAQAKETTDQEQK